MKNYRVHATIISLKWNDLMIRHRKGTNSNMALSLCVLLCGHNYSVTVLITALWLRLSVAGNLREQGLAWLFQRSHGTVVRGIKSLRQ